MVVRKWLEELNPLVKLLWNHGGEDFSWGRRQVEPHPNPWKAAVPQLVRAAVARDIAIKTKNQEAIQSASRAIDQILDDPDICPPPHLWPFPGPPPWWWQIASELTLVANSLHGGSLRSEIEEIITKVASRGTVAAGGE